MLRHLSYRKQLRRSFGRGIFTVLVVASSLTANAKTSLTLTSPKKDTSVSAANAKVKQYSDAYQIGDGVTTYVGAKGEDSGRVKLKWKANFKPGSSYRVTISESASFSSKVKKIYTKKKYCRIKNLYGGTKYYWKVSCRYKGKTITSRTFSFTTKNYPRTISVSGVSNVRDVGGYETDSGKVIRQGMVYRSAHMDKIKASGKNTMKKTLKIRTELDLRMKGEGKAGSKSALGKKTNYVNISAPMYAGVWKSEETKRALAKEMKVFADPKNYPIIFHCKYGRDRTGTLAFTLNALLGASKTDLYKDWELSFMSYMGTKTLKNNSTSYFRRFTALYNYMQGYESKKHPVAAGAPLSSHVEAFLLDYGMTKKEIATIRKCMLK